MTETSDLLNNLFVICGNSGSVYAIILYKKLIGEGNDKKSNFYDVAGHAFTWLHE